MHIYGLRSFSWGALALLLALGWTAAPLRAQAAPKTTEVIVLGLTHSAMLANKRQQPAAMRAFFEAVRPDAICVERAPEQFARNDHYEFTYEIQEIAVPWARSRGKGLCPFDWLPDPEDSLLAFGLADLERPPLLRPEEGFQQFFALGADSRTDGLFYAEAAEVTDRNRSFYLTHSDQAASDFARRLFLYRTFLQARRIAAAARAYPGGRILVLVGDMHKHDIENILAANPAITLLQPSKAAAQPTEAEIAAQLSDRDLAAIANFNLLGVQSGSDLVDLAWMESVAERLRRRTPGPEADLFTARLAELQKRSSPEAALAAYLRIAAKAGDRAFTWTGVKDRSRLDSFFDPFGNLDVAQRASVEAARLYSRLGRTAEAEAIKNRLRGTLATDTQRAQLDGYWPRYIAAR